MSSVNFLPPSSLFQKACRTLIPGYASSQDKEIVQQLLKKWEKLGFSKEAFLTAPDLVDFVFKSHLHRHIRHPDYLHTIEMKWTVLQRHGQMIRTYEPHLKMNGQMTAWSEIAKKLDLDTENRIYSKNAQGEKRYWMYLDQGFVEWDRHNFTTLRHFKVLNVPPQTNQIQIVTSQIPKERWTLKDYALKGSGHTFFRLIPRNGFCSANPGSTLRDGHVYSIGFGGTSSDFFPLQPLNAIRGRFYCPDGWEFHKEDLLVTTLNVTDEKLNKMMESVDRRNREKRPFHVLPNNCTTETCAILKEAGIVELKSGTRLDHLIYTVVFPKIIRRKIKQIHSVLSNAVSDQMSKVVAGINFVAFSTVFSPLLLLLGAWKNSSKIKEKERLIEPMFTGIKQCFDPDKFMVDLTMNVIKWQKKQPNTIYIKQD